MYQLLLGDFCAVLVIYFFFHIILRNILVMGLVLPEVDISTFNAMKWGGMYLRGMHMT
ncbi:hypothetical protein BO83DRAFT_127995 [Aspergillus eucalypticola CBS 122712]|uniref:Uncharacterized protein n=1 Tax=Aspergillus eucalypticola (strain CBS 122712 / IBT 29274) TaxID=1448314 RepID=A0A317UY68_ASPEC|nr:uncharacterized protein BO83DRAFT_127995 [Aspergillus eucalypticola CBS 122712]PWY64940.1 hypothetical protein BO83DRAFT_127995 [Aspergillus eucalypticola CBS 122712]